MSLQPAVIEILNGDTVVARSCEDNTNIIKTLDTGLQVPASLFGNPFKGEVNIIQFFKWLEDRCFPENRCGASELLEELGLEKYDPFRIVRLTNAKLFQDNFSVRWC